MKHQYFGDVDDYIKYGLLRTLAGAGLTVTACWMMTPDDPDPRDGRKLGYLADPAWRVHDPELFDFLRALDLSREGLRRDVSLIERPDLLPSVSPFGRVVPDDRPGRAAYFADLHRLAAGTDVVFFDPDNGFEIASRPRGRRGSSKHLFWDEAAGLYASGTLDPRPSSTSPAATAPSTSPPSPPTPAATRAAGSSASCAAPTWRSWSSAARSTRGSWMPPSGPSSTPGHPASPWSPSLPRRIPRSRTVPPRGSGGREPEAGLHLQTQG